jgi:hypothetical protein
MALLPPLVMAGTVWELLAPDQALSPSAEAVWIWASRSLLQGGAWALGLIVAALAALAFRCAAPRRWRCPAPW